MRKYFCLVLVALLILDCSVVNSQTPRRNGRSAEWEYKQLSDPVDTTLNHHAKEGWEVASASGGANDNGIFYRVILRRHKSHPLFGNPISELPKPESPPENPPNPKCKLTLAQAPVIRGLRLGMTSKELFDIFPANEREEFERTQRLNSAEPAPNYGYSSFQFILSNYATKDRFTGIGAVDVGLFDKKAVSLGVLYINTPQFDDLKQLIDIIAPQFGLPEYKDWPGSGYQPIVCDGFMFGVSGFNHNRFTIMLQEPTYTKTQRERRLADLAKKRVGFKL
jgi:hypothetical protein